MSLNRPVWFSIVAILFALIGMGSIVTGIEFSASYGSVSGGICFIYGLSAWAVAISLWICKPWAFHAVLIWSISSVLRIFNMQYGMKGDGTLPAHLFIPWVLFWITISVGLLYYVKQAFRKTITDSVEMTSESSEFPSMPPQENKTFKAVFYSLSIFLFVSFVNFAITINFISQYLMQAAIFNTLLNLLPIYFLAKHFISPLNSRTTYLSFWIGSLILSVLLVIPYGAFVLDFFIDNFGLSIN